MAWPGTPRTSSCRAAAGRSTRPASPRRLLVHGDADTIVPLGHPRHTAEVVPTATLRTRSGGGHVSVLLNPQLAAEVSASLR